MDDLSSDDEEALVLVDWTAGQLLPAPRKARSNRREMFFPVKCPQCERIRWLTRSAARKAQAEQRICRRCQTSNAGKLGWAATTALYGENFIIKVIQRQQLNKPSRPEAMVDHWLFAMKASYQRQVEFSARDEAGIVHNFILDFLVQTPQGPVPIEVFGYWHKRMRLDRDRFLSLLWTGQPVEFIDADTVISDPEAVKAQLQKLLSKS